MKAVDKTCAAVGVKAACEGLGVSRATYYRRRKGAVKLPKMKRSHRRLNEAEEQAVLEVLNSEAYADMAPPEVYADLLDKGLYLCSVSTMYRLLHAAKEVKERRHQRRQVEYHKPELLARGPNQVWSWDITKVRGPYAGCFYNLYVLLDVYSRYVVGWVLAERESGEQARALFEASLRREDIGPEELTVHSDRGKSMRSHEVVEFLSRWDVARSYSRPHVSNDNPYSESQFHTLKYRPGYPKRFGSIEDARYYMQGFFAWYNEEHRHSGIAYMTPSAVHHGRAAEVQQDRQAVLAASYAAHPERFVKGPPRAKLPPAKVWINRPAESPHIA